MIGSFLNKKYGTYSVNTQLAESLKNRYEFRFVSEINRKVLRIVDITIACLFSKYNIIHIDVFSGQAFKIAEISAFIAYLRKKKAILSFHGGKLPEFYQKNPKRIERLISITGYYRTPSLYLKNYFDQRGIQLHYLPNTIDLDRFPYNRKAVIDHSILWVRAFSEIYNPDLAIRILDKVQKTYGDAKITMIGPDKGLLSKTMKLINELDLNTSVTILGPIPNNLLYSYYQTHNVFINTTSYESFGVAVLEAAACGIPIVSSQVGEIPYMYLNNENIIMVESFEPTAFAVEICRIFSSQELAEKLSLNARRLAEQYDFENMKAGWVELLG